MGQRKVVTIFKIDLQSDLFDIAEGRDSLSPSEAIAYIKENVTQDNFVDLADVTDKDERVRRACHSYIKCPTKSDVVEDFSAELYYHIRLPDEYEWKDFYSEVTNEQFAKNRNNNLLCFIIYKNTHLFVISTGSAHNIVSEYIDFNFGFDFANIFLDKSSVEKASSRDFTGYFYARDYYLRRALNVDDIEGFGSVYSSFLAKFKPDIFKESFFTGYKDDFFNVKCEVANGIRIHKSINFSELLKLIKSIQTGLTKKAGQGSSFNSGIQRLSKLNPKHVELKKEISKSIFSYLFKEGELPDMEVCNKDYYNYYSACHYSIQGPHFKPSSADDAVKWDKRPNIEQILSSFSDNTKAMEKINTTDTFDEHFSAFSLVSEHDNDENDRFKTSGPILSHLQGEVTASDGTHHFLLDGYWYRVEQGYMEKVNILFSERIDRWLLHDKINFKPWSYRQTPKGKKMVTEGEYNKQYCSENNFIVADRLFVNNIEYFDLLYYKDDELYLVQVKKGFDAAMREACSQVRQAASSICNSVLRGKDELAKLYEEIVNNRHKDYFGEDTEKDKKNLQNMCGLSKDAFLSLFNKKKIFFVIAFTASNILSSKTVSKFESNIAKAEILSLSKFFKTVEREGVQFCLSQIAS